MASRHLARSVALQALFEVDSRDQLVSKSKIDEALNRNLTEFAPGIDDDSFAQRLVHGVLAKREKLDLIISKAAPDWPIDQVAVVDRNVLRIGLYELLFADRKEVPARVAINEAIELGKNFGGEKSGKFVNGVLGTVYRELGEPGKDEVPAKKKRVKDLPYDQMPIEKLAGAVVYARENGQLFLALVHDIFGYWTLSKGHIEANEDARQAVVREIKEELSLDIIVTEPLGDNEYVSSDPQKGKIRKQVSYFLTETKTKNDLKLGEDKGGLDEARWFSSDEIPELRLYDDIVPFITKAIKILVKNKKHGGVA